MGYLTRFLDDVRIPLTNNEAERVIRHAVVGRKNFYGSQTQKGAKTAMIMYTIVGSAKKVGLDPTSYILMVVRDKLEGKSILTPLSYARKIRLPVTKERELPHT